LGTNAPSLLVGLVSIAAYVAWTLIDRAQHSNAASILTPHGLRMPRIAGSRSVQRQDVESAFETDQGLVLKMKNGATVELGLVASGAGRILRHLGLTLDHAALVAPLRGQLGGFTRGLLTVCFAWPLLGATGIALEPRCPLSALFQIVAFLASLGLAVLVASKLRPRVVVGVDGIRVIGVLRSRFIPHREIRAVRVVDQLGYLSLLVQAGGRAFRLPLIGQSPEEAQALMRRIEEGRHRHGGAAGVRLG